MPEQTREQRASVGQAPGLVPACLAAIASGLLVWLWALPQLAQPAPPANAAASSLSEVAPDDMAVASSMLATGPALQARLRQEERKCGAHLAMVTVVRAPGVQAGEASLRFKSGNWFSPVFKVGDTPVRIAVPFPAPYAAGHGTLIVIRAGAEALMSLTPAWRLAGPDGQASREVSWTPARTCPTGADSTP